MRKKVMAHPPIWTKEYHSWDELPLLLDIEMACIVLRISEDSVRQMCRNGDLPAIRIGKQWRIDKEKLREKFGM